MLGSARPMPSAANSSSSLAIVPVAWPTWIVAPVSIAGCATGARRDGRAGHHRAMTIASTVDRARLATLLAAETAAFEARLARLEQSRAH